MIYTYINIILLIFILLAMYVTYQNRLLVFKKTNEFVLLVDEAKSVKDDLEQTLEQVLNISGHIIDNLNMLSEKQASYRISNDIVINEINKMTETSNDTMDNIDSDDIDDNEIDDNEIDDNEIDDNEKKIEDPVCTTINQTEITCSLDLQNIYSAVNNLYKHGFSTKEIAQELNKGQDEINLILNINNMKYIST